MTVTMTGMLPERTVERLRPPREPLIRWVAGQFWHCSSAQTWALGTTIDQAYKEWAVLEVARFVRQSRNPHLSTEAAHGAVRR